MNFASVQTCKQCEIEWENHFNQMNFIYSLDNCWNTYTHRRMRFLEKNYIYLLKQRCSQEKTSNSDESY